MVKLQGVGNIGKLNFFSKLANIGASNASTIIFQGRLVVLSHFWGQILFQYIRQLQACKGTDMHIDICQQLPCSFCLSIFLLQDTEMHRGKPLYLNEERYAALNHMVRRSFIFLYFVVCSL